MSCLFLLLFKSLKKSYYLNLYPNVIPNECALKLEIGMYSRFKKILWSSVILYITPTNGRKTK